jgi:hypothetical protein
MFYYFLQKKSARFQILLIVWNNEATSIYGLIVCKRGSGDHHDNNTNKIIQVSLHKNDCIPKRGSKMPILNRSRNRSICSIFSRVFGDNIFTGTHIWFKQQYFHYKAHLRHPAYLPYVCLWNQL